MHSLNSEVAIIPWREPGDALGGKSDSQGEPLRSAPDVGPTHVWTLQMKLVRGLSTLPLGER